jgi:hypothetical protein
MCGDLFMRDRRSRLRRADEETQGLTKRVDQGILRLTPMGRPEQARDTIYANSLRRSFVNACWR